MILLLDVVADGDGASVSDALIYPWTTSTHVANVIISPSVVYSTTTLMWFNSQMLMVRFFRKPLNGSMLGLRLVPEQPLFRRGLLPRVMHYIALFLLMTVVVPCPLSTAVFVTNTAPTAPSVVVSSSNSVGLPVAEEDDLVCEVSPISTTLMVTSCITPSIGMTQMAF